MKDFVKQESVVREIWSKSDTILFVFAGAAAEFALNKAVDWLYFTGRLPADPLGRLFSTVMYARRIVFSDTATAHKAIDQITAIHQAVENSRGSKIPDWAYRDVLFMLIHYSIAAYELLERKLTDTEKEDVYDVFYRMGSRMNLKDLPLTYRDWLPVRDAHLIADTARTNLTDDLFLQYRKHLGSIRYFILRQSQAMVVPVHVRHLLGMPAFSWAKPLLGIYKITEKLGVEWFFKKMLFPPKYIDQIRSLDQAPR